jgi:hypothetical protein
MTESTEQRYGWWSDQHEQAVPGTASAWQATDGQYVYVTKLNNSSTDPGVYKWPDAYCVGPVTKCIRMSDRTMQRLRERRQGYVVESIHPLMSPKTTFTLLRQTAGGWTDIHGGIKGEFATEEEVIQAFIDLSNGPFSDCHRWMLLPSDKASAYINAAI